MVHPCGTQSCRPEAKTAQGLPSRAPPGSAKHGLRHPASPLSPPWAPALVTLPGTRPLPWARQQVPEVALLPGDRVEHGGHHKEPTAPEAVDPGRDGLPVVVRQEVEVGAAEDAGNDPELEAGWGEVLQDQPLEWGPGKYRAPEQPEPFLQTCTVQKNFP